MTTPRWYNRPSSWAFVALLAFLTLVLGLASCLGATYTATNTELIQVQIALGKCVDGDTVQIPAGTSTWYGTLTVDKSITLQGAGSNVTRLVKPVGQNTFLSLLPADGNKTIRVTGIHFDLSSARTSSEDGVAILIAKDLRAMRIDHCFFSFGCRVIAAWENKMWGVIDHCTFLHPEIVFYPTDGDDTADDPVVLGTTNTCVVENCLIYCGTGGGYGGDFDAGSLLYGINAARCTFRYNTLQIVGTDANADFQFVDAHGEGGNWGRGTELYEIYYNTFSFDRNGDYPRLMYLRGGTHLVWSNTIVNPSENPGSYSHYALTDEWLSLGGGSCAVRDYLTNCFFWGDTLNGSEFDKILLDASGAQCMTEGVQYHLHAPGPTDIWYPYPANRLQYPHPLTGDPVPPASGPAISVTPSSRWFGYCATSTVTDLTFTITNYGASGTVAGSVSVSSPFSVQSGSPYSVATGTTANVTIRYTPTTAAGHTNTVTFTGDTDGGGNASVTVLGVGYIIQPDLTWNGTEGTVLAPFYATNSTRIVQAVTVINEADIPNMGLALYGFTITESNRYWLTGDALASDTGSDSLFINIDADPLQNTTVWHISPTNAAVITRSVTWPSSGGVKYWDLDTGNYVVYVRGREELMELASLSVTSATPAQPVLLLSPSNLKIRVGQSVYFTNLSSGFLEYSMYFDYPPQPEEENHWSTNDVGLCVWTYTNAGWKTVSVEALTNLVEGEHFVQIYTDMIEVTNLQPSADFVANITRGYPPLTVWVTNLTSNPGTTNYVYWGDGFRTQFTNTASHTYYLRGRLPMAIYSRSDYGSDSLLKEQYIDVLRYLPLKLASENNP